MNDTSFSFSLTNAGHVAHLAVTLDGATLVVALAPGLLVPTGGVSYQGKAGLFLLLHDAATSWLLEYHRGG